MANAASMRALVLGLVVLAGGAPVALADAPATGVVGVSAGSKLNLRTVPGSGRVLARLRRGTKLRIVCQRNGPVTAGAAGPSRVWDLVGAGGRRGYVADGFVKTDVHRLAAPLCGLPEPTPLPAGAQEGPCSPVAPVVLLAPAASVQELIRAAAPGARASAERWRVPASVTLAQAILETGGGRVSALANNFFGIKAQPAGRARWRWEDIAAGCVLKKTREWRSGLLAWEIAAFRAYATLDASILDHGRRLATHPAYRHAFAFTDDPRRFARAIARRYATDPHYADKLVALIERHRLERFDSGDPPPAAARG